MARFLTERTEIAKAINIKRYPTFIFDVTQNYKDYANYYKTDACMNLVVERTQGELHYEGHLYIELSPRVDYDVTLEDIINSVRIGKSSTTMLKSYFTQEDVYEMAESRALQEVRANDKVVVVFKTKMGCLVQLMKISNRVDPHCTTMAHLEPLDEKEVI